MAVQGKHFVIFCEFVNSELPTIGNIMIIDTKCVNRSPEVGCRNQRRLGLLNGTYLLNETCTLLIQINACAHLSQDLAQHAQYLVAYVTTLRSCTVNKCYTLFFIFCIFRPLVCFSLEFSDIAGSPCVGSKMDKNGIKHVKYL